jgi:succinate dehydrogenase / fumarate reductase, cytochrome b subunit
MKFAYYPGCCPQTTTRELDVSTRKIAMRLGIDLVDLNEAACCGSVELRLNDPDLFYATNGRTLAMAEAQGLDILTVCNTCELTLAQANKTLKEDHELLNKTNRALSTVHLKYSGGVSVKHLLWILLSDVGPAKIKKEIKKPLTSLKVAPFYGCHILRPKEILGFDDPDNPRSLDDFIQLCGAEPVDYLGKTKCCGAHIHGYKPELALTMTGKYLKQARDAGAQCMVTPCPLCFCMLDGHQKQANKKLGFHFNLPVFHLPQLLGLAMGMGEDELMLKRHMVSAHELLCQIGFA